MGRKREKQPMLPGTVEALPAEVEKAGNRYVELLYGRMKLQDDEEDARQDLIATMQKAGLEKMVLDDEYEVNLKTVEARIKVHVKKLKSEEEE